MIIILSNRIEIHQQKIIDLMNFPRILIKQLEVILNKM